MPDSNITYSPNLNLTLLPANYRVWAQIMNDNLVTLDAAINGFVQFTNLRGAWSNSTAYAVGDTVVDPLTAVLHTALVAHTSAQIPTTFVEDAQAHPNYWTLANAPANARGAWTGPGTTYQVNDFVLANGTKYAMCLVQHVSQATFDADLALGRWSVLIDLNIVGTQLLPVLSGPIDAEKFVSVNPAGTAYEIITGVTAMDRLDGILPVVNGGTGVNTSTGTGSNVLNTSPVFAGTPTTVTPPLADTTAVLVNAEWVKAQSYTTLTNVGTIYAPINSPNFNGVPTAPTPSVPNSNNNTIPNTAWVTAALAGGGASISVGTSPPGSPTANALWWNSDASTGGGQLYIYYNDGVGPLQWVPAAAGASAPTSPGGDFCAAYTGSDFAIAAAGAVIIPATAISGNSGSWYNSSNGRYTPPAGRYTIWGALTGFSGSALVHINLMLRKNGVAVLTMQATTAAANSGTEPTVNGTFDANGTDYFELFANGNIAYTGRLATFGAFPISGVKGPPGDPGVGLLQTVSYQTGAVATGTTLIPHDNTIPQITEGNEYMTLAITPRSATSRLIIEVLANLSNTSATAGIMSAGLFQDSTANALAVNYTAHASANFSYTVPVRHTMVSGTTSATTFRVRAGLSVAGTTSFNGYNGAAIMGGVMASSIVIQEVQ